MSRKLVQVGNSLALIIDKPLRRMMGLNPQREVNVRFDGRRLIVEPVDHAAPEIPRDAEDALSVAEILDAGPAARELCEQFDMSLQDLQRIHPRATRVPAFLGWMQSEEAVRSSDAEQRDVIRRMLLCHEQLRLGRRWDEAIAVALEAVPLVSQIGSNNVRTS